MTRTCFAQLPDTSYAQMPIFEDYSDAEKAEIIEWARRLDREEGVIACPIVSAAIMRWQEILSPFDGRLGCLAQLLRWR